MRYKLFKYWNDLDGLEYYRIFDLQKGIFSYSIYMTSLLKMKGHIDMESYDIFAYDITESYEIGYLRNNTFESLRETFPELFI